MSWRSSQEHFIQGIFKFYMLPLRVVLPELIDIFVISPEITHRMNEMNGETSKYQPAGPPRACVGPCLLKT